MTDAEYLRAMAKHTNETVGHTKEGREHIERLERIASFFSNGNADDARDAARWRKFCGLMAYGDFIVQHCEDGDAVEVIDFIEQLRQAVDDGSEPAARAGHEDDTRAWRNHNTEESAP